MPLNPTSKIETFPNPNIQTDYIIRFETQEFTCLCPLTGQPDFAHIFINYIPDKLNVELKSLKMYFWSFRDKGAFHEAITNEIFNHLVNTLGPRALKIQVKWFVRGGIYTTIEVENIKKSWSPIDSRILNKI
jgi:7-cyano-7-deazaguanine reductase